MTESGECTRFGKSCFYPVSNCCRWHIISIINADISSKYSIPNLGLYHKVRMNFIHKSFLYFIIPLLIFSNCSQMYDDVELPEHIRELENLTVITADTEPIADIQLTRDQSFGDSDDVFIGNIRDMVVDDQGRVFIADTHQNTVHVFNPDGSITTRIGRQGQGPGEFQGIYSMAIHQNQLYVYDYPLYRITTFSLDSFEHTHIINLNPENWGHIEELDGRFPTHFFIIDDNTILQRFVQISQPDQIGEPTFSRHYLLNKDGEIISDLIYEQRGVEYLVSTYGGGINFLAPPFIRSSLMAISANGNIFSAWSEEFLIKVYNLEGNYVRAFYYPYNQSSLDRREILDLYSDQPDLQETYRSTEFPESWPALHFMMSDDENRLWVSTISDDDEHYTWLVLSENGELLARFDWPGNRLNRDVTNLELIVVKNGYLYSHEVDDDTGLQQIVRYRIEKEEV